MIADTVDTLAGAAAAAAVIVLAPEAASAVVVAGVGGAVAYAATEAVTALTHDGHWGDNIHKYGVLDGIGHSFVDAGGAFVKDNVETAQKIGNTVVNVGKSIWHGIFG